MLHWTIFIVYVYKLIPYNDLENLLNKSLEVRLNTNYSPEEQDNF